MSINIPTSSTARPSKIYPNSDFWFANVPSGNSGLQILESQIFPTKNVFNASLPRPSAAKVEERRKGIIILVTLRAFFPYVFPHLLFSYIQCQFDEKSIKSPFFLSWHSFYLGRSTGGLSRRIHTAPCYFNLKWNYWTLSFQEMTENCQNSFGLLNSITKIHVPSLLKQVDVRIIYKIFFERLFQLSELTNVMILKIFSRKIFEKNVFYYKYCQFIQKNWS
jgi:hypothetical protein